MPQRQSETSSGLQSEKKKVLLLDLKVEEENRAKEPIKVPQDLVLQNMLKANRQAQLRSFWRLWMVKIALGNSLLREAQLLKAGSKENRIIKSISCTKEDLLCMKIALPEMLTLMILEELKNLLLNSLLSTSTCKREKDNCFKIRNNILKRWPKSNSKDWKETFHLLSSKVALWRAINLPLLLKVVFLRKP